MGVYRLGKRLVPELMQDLFGLQMSLGAVIDCQQAASDAMAVPVEQATTFAQRQPVKHADETSWREGPQRARVWLWTVVTSCVTVFCIHARETPTLPANCSGRSVGCSLRTGTARTCGGLTSIINSAGLISSAM